jgi:magnesium transporter
METAMQNVKIDGRLLEYYFRMFPDEVANFLYEVPIDTILLYFKRCEPDISKEILVHMDNQLATAVLTKMDDALFSTIISRMDTYRAAILVSRLEERVTSKKLKLLTAKLSSEINELLTYPPESAAFLMDTRMKVFNENDLVSKVLHELREVGDKNIVNVQAVDDEGKFLGSVPIHSIAVSPPSEVLANLIKPSVNIQALEPREEVVKRLQEGKLVSLPVVDINNRLLGIIRYDALVKAAQHDATEDSLTRFGAGREERALSNAWFAVRKRLPWLEINLVTAFLAASVVGLFEETIARITVLAVFLPVVAGQSGNTGSQALAVTIRGLALREIQTGHWFKVARKEAAVGLINGIAISLTTSIIVFLWASSLGLAIVIGVSMIFSMVIAGFSGAVIPILLKSLGQDPAQSSSIVLTTVTDIVGFLSFLGLATAMSPMIGT